MTARLTNFDDRLALLTVCTFFLGLGSSISHAIVNPELG